jgi:hypothetical protein
MEVVHYKDNELTKRQLIETLHGFMSGQVTNLKLAMKEKNIEIVYDKKYENLKGILVLTHHYDVTKHEKYIFALYNFHRLETNEAAKKTIDSNAFYRFLFELSRMVCHKYVNAIQNGNNELVI